MLNTKDLIKNLTSKNKSFITRVANRHEKKYGNVDVFTALLNTHNKGTYFESTTIEMQFGENSIEFTFNTKGEIVSTYGNGQGHKYHKSLEECAKELFQKREELFPYCL